MTTNSEQDPLYERAVEFVQLHASINIYKLQRKLRVNLYRAADLMKQMENNRIVTAPEWNGVRTVIHKPLEAQEETTK